MAIGRSPARLSPTQVRQISADLFPERQKVLAKLVSAFNSRDLDSFGELFLEGFVAMNSEGAVTADGLPALLAYLTEAFKHHPKLQIRVDASIGVGDLLAHTEHVFNFADGHSENSIWVYEFSGVKIAKWHGYVAKAS